MPPTFPIFIGIILYLILLIIAFVIGVPMLFIKSKRLIAKKVIISALISFPCLLIVGFFFAIIFIIPALSFSWLANSGYIPKTLGIIIFLIGALIVVVLVALSSLYLWYFLSKVIYCKLERKPYSSFLDNNKAFTYLRPYLMKRKLYKV